MFTHRINIALMWLNSHTFVFMGANALLTGNLKWHVFAVFLAKQVPL